MSAGAIFLTVSFFASFFVAAYYMLKNDELERDNKALWEQMYMNEAKARNWDKDGEE